MAFPTLEKEWQFSLADSSPSINLAIGPSSTGSIDRRKLLVKLVQCMVGFKNNPWTIKACSYWNGSSWVVDTSGTNRWTSYSNLGWSDGGNRSWIILHNEALGYDICWDCNVYLSIDNQWDFYWSPGALYTASGTPSAPPVPGDRQTIQSDGTWVDSRSQWYYPTRYQLHVMHSVDGTCTRIMMHSDGGRPGVMLFEHMVDVVGTWAKPYMIYPSNYDNYLTWSELGNGTRWWAINGSTILHPYLSTEVGYTTSDGALPQLTGGVPSRLSGVFGATPFGAWTSTTNFRGRIGRLTDLWLSSQAIEEGATFTYNGVTFCQWGHILVPWSYSAPCETS